jgi:hypothetical protein
MDSERSNPKPEPAKRFFVNRFQQAGTAHDAMHFNGSVEDGFAKDFCFS